MEAIVAVDENWGIGYQGDLLAHISADLKRFKEITMGRPVLMGRATLESLPGGRPLKGRENLVLSRSMEPREDCAVVGSLEEALPLIEERKDLMLIGGAAVYRALADRCSRIYVTKIHKAFPADCYFPNLDQDPAWEIEAEEPVQTEGNLSFHYVTYRRKEQ